MDEIFQLAAQNFVEALTGGSLVAGLFSAGSGEYFPSVLSVTAC